jgi:hypothetical protein
VDIFNAHPLYFNPTIVLETLNILQLNNLRAVKVSRRLSKKNSAELF